jgi:hypothetical protein
MTKTPEAPGLKRLGSKVKVSSSDETPKKSSVPVVLLDVEQGDIVKRYNEAKEAADRAAETMNELRPQIVEAAKEHIFENNCAPGCLNPLTSVKLQELLENPNDPESEPVRGELIRVSFTSRYNTADAEFVDAMFKQFKGRKRNINDYVTETLTASFDSTVWLDEDGNFNQAVYDKFRIAIEKVAKELDLKDAEGRVKSPLTTKRTVQVKEAFHQRRFTDFSVEENHSLSDALPNTIQCVPVR